jgi:hypothetical protein
MVNTCNAGAGALAVTVEGPSKVKLECREADEGYEFTYNPTAPGDYMITIRYAGVNIAGSPFKAKIEGINSHSATLFMFLSTPDTRQHCIIAPEIICDIDQMFDFFFQVQENQVDTTSKPPSWWKQSLRPASCLSSADFRSSSLTLVAARQKGWV